MRFIAAFASSLALAAGAHAAMEAADMVNNINQITDISSEANDIAKSLSAINVFQKAPQLVNDFKQIIDTVTKDITAMNAKRDISNLPESAEDTLLRKRQECLDVTDIEKCIADLGEIVDDPSEILGSRKRDIVSDITSKVPVRRRQESPVYNEVEQSQVCNAFRNFVQVHQALLKTVIGKHGLLSLTPFTQPIASVLRTLEGGVDTIAFGIIDTVPTCAEGATNDKNSLDSTLADAQDTYN